MEAHAVIIGVTLRRSAFVHVRTAGVRGAPLMREDSPPLHQPTSRNVARVRGLGPKWLAGDPGEIQGAEALVIEDDVDARRLVASCLRRLGLRVLEAATGAEACALLKRSVPAVICLDLRLPDADGLALCERIRASARLRDVPVVVITAQARAIDRAQAELAGADEYVIKPFRMDALADAIR